ncbi:Protein DJ-1-like protein B [Picochlorum sp. SENEW3]|nr:Protein DJ-1-like protein B [Picochlorum sp. SENEW3]
MASASKNPSVLIPIANGSEEMEAIIIADVLRRAEAQVTLASVEETTQVICSRGVNIVADKLIGECAEEQFELIALPGGMPGAQNLADSEMLSSILKKHQASDKPLAAICAAPQVVLNTQGYLEGRHATAHPAFSDKLGNQERVSDRVVIDGNIITSRGPGTAMEFALTIVGRLFGPDKMKQVAGPMVMHSDWDTFVA